MNGIFIDYKYNDIKISKRGYSQSPTSTSFDISSLFNNISDGRYGLSIEVCAYGDRYYVGFIMGNKNGWKTHAITQNSVDLSIAGNVLTVSFSLPPYNYWINIHAI